MSDDRIPFMLHIPQTLLSSLEADARLVQRSTNAHILRILENNTDAQDEKTGQGLTFEQALTAQTWMAIFAEHYTNARELSQGCGEDLRLEDPIGETFLADDLYDMALTYYEQQPEEDQ